jgi:hypothetical protein
MPALGWRREVICPAIFAETEKRRHGMGARQKLNAAYFQGSVIVAGIAGLIAETGLVFFLVLVVLVGANVYAGEIRPTQRGKGIPPAKQTLPPKRRH